MQAAAEQPQTEQFRKYIVRFYEPRLYEHGKEIAFSKLLIAAMKSDKPLAVRELIENKSEYQVRGLHPTDNDREIRGCFVRFRPDIPVTGSRSSLDEKPLLLDDGHTILEKNYFTLFIGDNYEVLAFQQSQEGGSISGLARYFSAIAGDDRMVSFNDILTEESLESLLKGAIIKSVDFRVAKPKGSKYVPDPDDTWTQKAMDFMAETGTTTFQAKLAIRAPSQGIFSSAVGSIQRLLSSPQTRKLKIKLSDHAEPIDLFADRIKDRIDVKLKNGQPVPEDVYKGIWASKIKLESSLASYLGK